MCRVSELSVSVDFVSSVCFFPGVLILDRLPLHLLSPHSFVQRYSSFILMFHHSALPLIICSDTDKCHIIYIIPININVIGKTASVGYYYYYYFS